MDKQFVMAFDEGTTGCRTILFDKGGNVYKSSYREFTQIFPKPGWVEHDPMEIWEAQMQTMRDVMKGVDPQTIATIGITNQRETCVVWEADSGKPVNNALVWQDKRTSGRCEELKKSGLNEYVRENTGLIIDSYFSGTKIKWILDNIPNGMKRAKKGELRAGTIDSWLIWNLTCGKSHVIDYCNASRTLLFNIKCLEWDERMLSEIGVPREILPTPMPSASILGMTDESIFEGVSIPIGGACGDQQAALFGQACFEKGMVKATYGTGGTLVMNLGEKPIVSDNGMLTSVAWGLDGKVNYSLEGLLYVVGAAVQWLRDGLQIIDSAEQSEQLAQSVSDTGGVYVVPAFVGMAAPYWDQFARGTIVGITRGTTRAHIVRATCESMAYQIRDVVDCMKLDSGIDITQIKVDGGACKNNFLMQFQADILDTPILRPKVVETTARGAAFLAGLSTGFWKDTKELVSSFELDREFVPNMQEQTRSKLYGQWKRAVERSLSWEEHE
jgi:glycerol kinase